MARRAAPPVEQVCRGCRCELGHEIACHGWRWIHYQNIDEAHEREHVRIAIDIIMRVTGEG